MMQKSLKMEEYVMYVEEDLVFYNLPVNNQDELFDFMSNELEEKGYVTADFREAIKKREEKYPTGMKLNGLNVAIAHTEIAYARAEKLMVIKPENPIKFRNIENLTPLDVDLVFAIILNNSDGHLEILKKISQMFQEQEVIDSIKNIGTRKELATFMHKYFN